MNIDLLNEKVLQVTKTLENQVDAAIGQLENLDVNDLEGLRKQRLKELKDLQNKKQEWVQNGHGKYEELPEEKAFFDAVKKSENVIVHFFTNTNTRSPIVDMHLKKLAPKHLETRFLKLNAEKCPFLAERLHIKTIPSIVCVNNGIVIDKVVGFSTLGNSDDFSTETMEWRLAQNKIINYEGDLSAPPDQIQKEKVKNKTIREGRYNNESDEDLEIEDFSLEHSKIVPPIQKTSLTAEEAAELGLSDEES